jgi:ferrous iron transport protein A
MSCPGKSQSQRDDAALRPLSCVQAGESVRIARIKAECRGLANRLASMGLMVNVEITVVNNGHPGPFVVGVRESKVVLGRGMADKIMVV